MPHAILYHRLVMAPITEMGGNPRLEKTQAPAAFFLQKRTEKSCLSLVAAQPQPNLLSPR